MAINTQRCECCVMTPHCVISYSQQYYIQRRSTHWTELLAEPQPHSQQQRRQLQPQLLSNKIMDVDQHKEGQVALVTGSSGFLGQHLVKLLHEKAPQFKEIRTFDIKPYKQKLGKFVNPSY